MTALNWNLVGLFVVGAFTAGAVAAESPYAEIRVIDAATGRGVPLVELETVNGLTFVTDNAGRVAFHEPGLMGREVFFTVRSHGYEMKKDGFGFAGIKLTPKVGAVAEFKLPRKNLAERLCRLTGEGLYRDSELLGHPVPKSSANPGRVAGQDSVQTAIHRGKVYWFWGDTNRMEYPLGLFRMAGATTTLFDAKDPNSDPVSGIPFNYFTDAKSGFARAMLPLPERPQGVVWVGALAVVPDDKGRDVMVGHYTRRKSLAEEIEQGICVYDDEKELFTVAKELPLKEAWRRPGGHPIAFEEKGVKWLLFGSPTPNVRVPAMLKAILDPETYEAFTPLNEKGEVGPWSWQKALPPLGSKAERELVKSGKMKPEQARFTPNDVVLHSGSVRWNEHRKRWVLLAGQIGGKSSLLGEVWYAEAEHPTGPFTRAVQVVTHEKQTFYNVCHHGFLDRDGGRVIHFEGTYTNDFSGNPHRTPRYNYNQVLYRLDLDSPELKPARMRAPGLERAWPNRVEMVSVAEELKTHPPQRPLPEPRNPALAKGPTFLVDPVRGDDKADGSVKKPWRTLTHATRGLKPGDTLYLRGGVYHEKVSFTRSGTVEKPITIAAHPGELPILDGGLREFRETPATAWEPFKGGAPGEYVSTKAYPQANDRRAPYQFLPGSWEPMWNLEDQRPLTLGHFADSLVPLHGYRTLEDLRATNEFQPKDKKAGGEGVYCGPGMWFNRETNRIHVRLAHHRLAGLGDRAYRGETDPRKIPLVVAVGFGDDVLRLSGVQHVRIEGLVLRGATGSPMIHVYGSEGIDLDHLHVYGGFPGLLVNASRKIRVTHCAFRGLAAPWTGRAHMKYRGTATYQIVLQNSQPVNEDIEFAHCEFTDDHDFAFLRFAKNLRFHHNHVDNFNDDGLECGAKLRWHNLHIHHNRIGACLGVFQQHEIDKDESPATHDADSGVHVYRNIFDQRAGVYYTLPATDDPTGAFLHSEGHLISDHGSPVYPVMRVYHNTFLRREPVFRDYFLFGLGAANLKQTERDVFNNLFVQADRVPGAVILGKEAGPLREGGNLLWGVQEGPTRKGDVFARLRASPLFVDSKKYHEPGWSTLDQVADPKFKKLDADWRKPSDLRLSEGSAAINAGVVLPERWPDPLREKDEGKPDIGAIPFGADGWGVGVDGRVPVFGK